MKLILPALLSFVLITALDSTFAKSAFAQAVTAVAQLNGTVRDSTGAAVPNLDPSQLDTNRTHVHFRFIGVLHRIDLPRDLRAESDCSQL
jgi:hypothetical protein